SPGTNATLSVRITRKGGFTGAVQLGIEGLPAKVKASCGVIPAGSNDGCIVLQAAADAPQGAANVRVTGTADKVTVEARPLQETYAPGGGRIHYPVAMHTVSVAAPLDLLGVTISPTEVTLKPGESRRIEVTVKRQPGYKANLSVDIPFRHLNS